MDNKFSKNFYAQITERISGSKRKDGTFARRRGGRIEPSIPVAPPETPVSEAKEGKGVKSSWVKHVADFAHKNNMNYFEALKDPKVKLGYKKV